MYVASKVPTVIALAQQGIKDGYAPVIGLQRTGEAAANAREQRGGGDEDDEDELSQCSHILEVRACVSTRGVMGWLCLLRIDHRGWHLPHIPPPRKLPPKDLPEQPPERRHPGHPRAPRPPHQVAQ
jgi:hypothetical protein